MKTKKSTRFIASLLALAVVFNACKKTNEPTPAPSINPPTAQNFQKLRDQTLQNLTQTKTFKAEQGITFTSKKGVKLIINPNCLIDENGNSVTGDVELSYIELFNRGNMALTNKPVMGRDFDGNVKPLITGGEFFIDVKQGNKKLRAACSMSLQVPGSITGGLNSNMIAWDGIIDDAGNLTFEQALMRETGMLEIDEKLGSYYFSFYRIGNWINIDQFFEYPGQKTKIKVAIPSGYNDKNSAVYIAFGSKKYALAQLNIFNATGNYYTENYGYTPVGEKVYVIFVSEHNGSVVYAIKEATIQANHTITVRSEDLKISTPDAFNNAVDALQ